MEIPSLNHSAAKPSRRYLLQSSAAALGALLLACAPDPISKVPGRYGWMGGFGTDFIVDPNRDLISIVMTQSSDYLFNGARERFSSELYTATA